MSPPEVVTYARKTSKPYHTSHIVTLCHTTVIHYVSHSNVYPTSCLSRTIIINNSSLDLLSFNWQFFCQWLYIHTYISSQLHSVCNDVFCQDVQRLLCCVDECPAATERRRCCGGSLLNRGLKTVSNFVTWWCGEPGSVMMLLGVGAHHCTTTAVCRPTCPRLQHLTALHCLDQELSIQGDLACSQDLQLSFRFPASHQLYVLCVWLWWFLCWQGA